MPMLMQLAGLGLIFCLSLYLHPYFVYASSEGSGKSVHHRNFLKNMFSRDKTIQCYQALQKASNSFETN